MISFSALSKRQHETHIAKDRDEEFQADDEDENKEFQPGLLPKSLGSGAALGNKIHNIFEQYFGNGLSLTEAILIEFERIDELRAATMKMLTGTIPLAENTSPCLEIFAQKAITEMHFIFPMKECSPKKLSDTLLQMSFINQHPRRQAWAAAVSSWSFSKLRGYLQGYIDLITEFAGQWYLADYKTNLLTGYGPEECESAMIKGQYLLQGLIYAVALHRHLQANLVDYQYDLDFGGIVYLFVRGLEAGQGVWSEKPILADIDLLDSLFREGC